MSTLVSAHFSASVDHLDIEIFSDSHNSSGYTEGSICISLVTNIIDVNTIPCPLFYFPEALSHSGQEACGVSLGSSGIVALQPQSKHSCPQQRTSEWMGPGGWLQPQPESSGTCRPRCKISDAETTLWIGCPAALEVTPGHFYRQWAYSKTHQVLTLGLHPFA